MLGISPINFWIPYLYMLPVPVKLGVFRQHNNALAGGV